ncbi:MAG: Na(+)/H(+) antiporter subunit D [Desulfosarcina sp.]|jgi:multicomponent Na+:H+ antiporter subunit D
MINPLPPAVILIAGAFLVPCFKGRLQTAFLLSVPVLTFVNLVAMPVGTYWTIGFLGYDLIFGRVDKLSLAFGFVFVLITFIGVLYSLNVAGNRQHMAGLVYAGGALGVTFAGDLFSLYVFWEILALASVFLILARRQAASSDAAFRYFMWHFFGGLCLLAGIVLYVIRHGTAEFAHIGLTDWASGFIFIGFCLNAAVFPLHAWLPDAYPRATVGGAVFMSALTTKSAVYILARTFAGTESLIWAGALMTCFPIFYAVIVNDMRRVLAYSLINQVGFMVCGIGIGTPLAINGVVAHAFCHIIYKALLFMSTGAVLHMTGRIRATDLGGLYKTMPYTAVCCMIGAASISAFPLFSGFVSKSMTVTAAAEEHMTMVWLMLMFASAGVFHHAGIKVPFFIFFGHDAGIRTQEPPLNMRLAMGLAAFICIFLGVYPKPLYDILPYPVAYIPYTAFHVLAMLELLMFGALAFTVLVLAGHYPPEMRAVNLDTDWFVRLPGRLFIRFCGGPLRQLGHLCEHGVTRLMAACKRFPDHATRLEKGVDAIFHSGLTALPDLFYAWARHLKTEMKQLSWNLAYILMPFCILLAVMLLWLR